MYHSNTQINNTVIVALDAVLERFGFGGLIHQLGQTIIHLTVRHRQHKWTILSKFQSAQGD